MNLDLLNGCVTLKISETSAPLLGLNPFGVNLDLGALCFIAFFVFVDLLLRWFAFGRVESVALEVTFFSTTSVVFRALGEGTLGVGGSGTMGIVVLELILWLLAYATHAVLYHQLHETVSTFIKKVAGDSVSVTARDALIAVAKRASLVTVSGNHRYPRVGKYAAREELASLVNEVCEAETEQGDYVISPAKQLCGAVAFFLLAAASVLVAVVV